MPFYCTLTAYIMECNSLASGKFHMSVFYNARGAGDRLGLTSERIRQLFREGKIQTTALLNGKVPLVDDKTLEAFAAQRAQERRRAAAVHEDG
jgi:hypothetical protein